MVAASRPRCVSGSGASMRTSAPSTVGVKRRIGAARLCCSLRTTPLSGQDKRAVCKHLGPVTGPLAVGQQRADDPPWRLPVIVLAKLDGAPDFPHESLPYQRPIASSHSSESSSVSRDESRRDTSSRPGSTIRSVAPAPSRSSKNLRRADEPSELVAITSICLLTAPCIKLRRVYSTSGKSRLSRSG